MTHSHLPQLREQKTAVDLTPLEFLQGTLYRLKAANELSVPDRMFYLVGADGGESPAGVLQRTDAVRVVSGTNVTKDGQSLDEIWRDLQRWLTAFNGQAEALVAMLSFVVDHERERTAQYTNPGFQDASEFGEPNEISLQYVFRGFPLRHKDLKIGFTQEFLDDALGREVAAVRTTAEAAWRQIQKNHVLEALFGSANYTTRQGIDVVRLWNADGEVPPPFKRWTHDGTHTHYLTTGIAAHDATDVDAMAEHVVHHGFTDVDDSVLTLHQHRDEIAVSRTLAEWVPADQSNHPVVTTGPIVGLRTGRNGLRVEGFLGEVAVVMNNDIPQLYHLMTATGGAFTQENPVGFRVHENRAARGLRLTPGPIGEYPIRDAVYDGYVGAGIRHRSSAVVMQSTAGAYADPTFTL